MPCISSWRNNSCCRVQSYWVFLRTVPERILCWGLSPCSRLCVPKCFGGAGGPCKWGENWWAGLCPALLQGKSLTLLKEQTSYQMHPSSGWLSAFLRSYCLPFFEQYSCIYGSLLFCLGFWLSLIPEDYNEQISQRWILPELLTFFKSWKMLVPGKKLG